MVSLTAQTTAFGYGFKAHLTDSQGQKYMTAEQWQSISVQFERRSEGRVQALEAPQRYINYGDRGQKDYADKVIISRLSSAVQYSDYKVASKGYIEEIDLMKKERGSKQTLDFIAKDIKDYSYELTNDSNEKNLYNKVNQLATQEAKDKFPKNVDYTPKLSDRDYIMIGTRSNIVMGYVPNSLSKDSDFDLKPEVQQMVGNYDDMSVYNFEAYKMGLINDGEFVNLQLKIQTELAEIRKKNKVEKGDLKDSLVNFFVADILIGEILTGGVLGSPDVAYAASLDMSASDKISKNHARITGAITANKNYKYSVYEMVDDEGNVRYVGRTRQDLEKRAKQHRKNDPNKRDLRIRPASLNDKFLEGLSYEQARGLEQMVYENHNKNGNKLLNKIRPLDIDNPKKAGKVNKYLEAARKFIGKVR